ncbi:MAG: hypothetical protein HZB56_13045 [Deltaproteobacteria bacterium]|nr:hypothetical protein [Deltaproteobacteria bacterium]
MKSSHKLGLAAGGIAAFAALALVAIVRLTDEPRRVAQGPETIQPAPPPDGPPPQPPQVPTSPAEALAPRAPPEPAPPVQYDKAPDPPPPESWEAVPVSARAASLGTLGAAVGRSVNALQPQLAACWAEADARGGAVAPTDNYTETREGEPPPDATTTILVLQVESHTDELQIVDAPVEAQGTASYGVVACAQRVLRGHRVPAPGVQAGQRYRILQPLTR